jgi:hypothetical protein
MARAPVTAQQAATDPGPGLAASQLLRGQLEEDLGDLDAAEAAYRGAVAEAEGALAEALAIAGTRMARTPAAA